MNLTEENAQQRDARPDTMDEKTAAFGRNLKAREGDAAVTEANASHPPNPRLPARRADENLTTHFFQFLSTATPGTLGGVGVGLAAVTHFLLGQLGLLLIGAFGGIILLIQWEQRDAAVARAVKGERGYDVLQRLLDAKKDPKLAIASEAEADGLARALAHGFDDFQPETRDAMNELVDAIIRDHVRWWYAPIVPSDKFFPLSCRKTLTSFLVTVSSHLRNKRPADAFLDFLTNSSSMVIVFFSELSNAFAELPSDSKMKSADAVRNYLSTNPESSLANLLNERQQAGKFRMVSEDLLNFLDRQTYECDLIRVFLREILAGVILEMTLQTCSKPEWINAWIVYFLEAGEPDLNQVIDVGMQTGPNATEIASVEMDGNVGNTGLSKGNRSSFEAEKARRKDLMAHKKKLSKADEEMAVEEMKRMNQMIADADKRRSQHTTVKGKEPRPQGAKTRISRSQSRGAEEASRRLSGVVERNADELDMRSAVCDAQMSNGTAPRSSSTFDKMLQKDLFKDGFSMQDEAMHSPITPRSTQGSNSEESSPVKRHSQAPFTSFEQIAPPAQDEAEMDTSCKATHLTLHNATITILDEPGDNRVRNKPSWDYLIQIEPVTATYPGWMIVRKYVEFERLHEVLRRIATISGATAFTEQHTNLPAWKLHTRTSLRGDLERYLRDACWYQSLADCEGMKKFLERDSGHIPTGAKLGLQAFEKLGKNVFDVLASAPVEGSKAVVGGVTGVLGNIGLVPRKQAAPTVPASLSLQDVTAASRLSIVTPPRMESIGPSNGSRRGRDSMDSQPSSVVATQPGKVAPMERRSSHNSHSEAESEIMRASRSDGWERAPSAVTDSRANSRASSAAPIRSSSAVSLDGMRLPPPPDTIPDDYESHFNSRSTRIPDTSQGVTGPKVTRSMSTVTLPALSGTKANGPSTRSAKQYAKLSEQETRVAVELFFAVINELYTLSSAWNIRRTLLAAAKSFLLRPGNPSLVSIQSLIQASVLDANTLDSGIATHLRKLRENTMPTEKERAAWPTAMTVEEKEKLRVKARRLLIESGVPAALTGVMGQTATSDALGRLFDCLQVEEVARGLMFGVLLQAVRTVTH